MSDGAYQTHLDNLNRSFPPPAEAITLDDLCVVLPHVKKKTLQNHASDGKLPFPVIKVGGKVLVAKTAVAALLAGIPIPSESQASDGAAQPQPRRRGRPRNSVGLQRFAALSFLRILHEEEARNRADLEGVLAGQTFGSYQHKRIGPSENTNGANERSA